MTLQTLTELLESRGYSRIHQKDRFIAKFEHNTGHIIDVRVDLLMIKEPHGPWLPLTPTLEELLGKERTALIMNGVSLENSLKDKMNTKDVAIVLGITPQSVRRLKKNGTLIPKYIINTRLYYSRQQVLDLIENKMQLEMLITD